MLLNTRRLLNYICGEPPIAAAPASGYRVTETQRKTYRRVFTRFSYPMYVHRGKSICKFHRHRNETPCLHSSQVYTLCGRFAKAFEFSSSFMPMSSVFLRFQLFHDRVYDRRRKIRKRGRLFGRWKSHRVTR